MSNTDELEQIKKENEKLKEQINHYKIYAKSWQKSRAIINDVLDDKTLSKEEKVAISTIFNTMTQALDEVVRN